MSDLHSRVPREWLEEMNLLPVWRARAAPPPTVASTPGQAPSSIGQMDWATLKATVSACTACRLHEKRTQAVFGVGDEQADWLFVGEGPGAEEDLQGEPFVGQAGKLLDNMLASIELRRGEKVYIANVVKCRPPGNRNPEPDEAAACAPYLDRQISLIAPKLLIALGKVAATRLLGRDASIASLRGKLLDYQGRPLIVTYHPAYLLRNLGDKAKAWEDLCFIKRTMDDLKARSAATT
jgi:DNA polymerase